MLITRKSIITGIRRTMNINVTDEQLNNWANGELIQKAMPHLSINEREFIMSGITQDEWDEEFKGNE